MARLVVEADCPTCAAPLDLREGTHAIRCGHCASNLLVTGRKRVLAYTIEPTVEAREAAQIARFGQPTAAGSFRLGDPRLHFVPYWRMTGHDYRWARAASKPEPDPLRTYSSPIPDMPAIQVRTRRLPSRAVEFRDRHVEKSFLAVELPGFPAYSLGVKTSALPLRLFSRAHLRELDGHVVSPTVGVEAARAIGLRAPESRVLLRVVLDQTLAHVYYPYWLVPLERPRGTTFALVDGVSRTIVVPDAPPSLAERLGHELTAEPEVVGFRPLVCPNCGWDLPVRPDDLLFACGHCTRVWLLDGNELRRVPHEVAAVPRGGGEPATHLPFWIVAGRDRRFFVPAFRYRRLKHLVDVGLGLTERSPELAPRPKHAPPPDLGGGTVDPEDARGFAELLEAGLERRSVRRLAATATRPVEIAGGALAWLPFLSDGYNLRDPWSGKSLTRTLLL